jgi:energy-coupling factor transport system permease protein
MLTEYQPGTSLAHRLDVRSKLFCFVVIIALAFGFQHPVVNGTIVLGLFISARVMRLPMEGIGRLFSLLAPVFVVMFAVTAFASTPEQFTTASAQRVLFTLFPGGAAPLTIGGILVSLTLIFRIGVFVLASLMFAHTTPVDDFILLARRLRVSHKFAFIITMAVRFVPTMEGKAGQVLDAQRARGVDLLEGGFMGRLRAYVTLMIPMVVDSIRMSETLAISMVNRGFGATKASTQLDVLKMKGADYVVVIAAGVLLVLGVVMMQRGTCRL